MKYNHDDFAHFLKRDVEEGKIKIYGKDKECLGYALHGKGNFKRMCSVWTVI